ncbi:MAG: glycoside hydrolase family 3 C-terminal domain-containing protein, partial [Clostridia bacterium]|nr:glycoside hydrolase family 3 C-terminal domain-containing protein [Clostridia bacterium]
MYKMEKWARINYQPSLPLGDNFSRVTGCQRHIDVARRAAIEGTVLLKNEGGVLPFAKGTKLAIFGLAQIDYVKGGGGSGMVYSAYVRNIYEGLKEKENKVTVFDKLSLFYENAVCEAYRNGGENGRLTEIAIPADLLSEARAFTDTAIITLCRFSGEGWDRKNDGTDTYFSLSNEEKAMVKAVSDTFSKVVVLLNTGAMIDTSWFADNNKIQGAVMIW